MEGASRHLSDLDKFTFVIKVLRILGMSGDILNLIKGVFGIDKTNVVFNGDIWSTSF